MADDASARTYALTVPLHGPLGGPPPDSDVTVRVARTDGRTDAPLYGPRGLLLGAAALAPIRPDAVVRTPIDTTEITFRLLPTAYYETATHYLLTAGNRAYRFAMPARDASMIELLDDETP